MALQKNIEMDTGIVASYHKIGETQIDWHRKSALIVVYSFINQDAKVNGKSFVCTYAFEFYDDDFPFIADVRAEAYTAIKTLELFQNAVDV